MSSAGSGFADDLGPNISQEELDFSDLFLYHVPGEDFPGDCDKDDLQSTKQPPLLVVDLPAAYISGSDRDESSQDTSPLSPPTAHLSGVMFDSLGQASRPGTVPAPSPRIEITPSGDSLSSQTLELSPGTKAPAYRECVSPASSNSSTGWPAEALSPLASPCISPSNGGSSAGAGFSSLDLCPGLQGIHTSSAHSSPGASPRNSVTDETFLVPRHQRAASSLPHQRSRSASPHGKRCYDPSHPCPGATPVKQRSRSPSPIPSLHHEQQGSYYLHQYQAHAEFHPQTQSPPPGLEEMLSGLSSGPSRAPPYAAGRDADGPAQRQDCVYGLGYEQEVKSETFYMLPTAWSPPHALHHGALSGLAGAPLPSLEWPLPSQSGQYELLIQQEPRSHHRAHYETEGSRGAVKTPNGGHPEVQLRGYQGPAPLGLQVFIGTADERILKPHAFYQVHRITGKTVTTPSTEHWMNGTKVLEIPLEPKNHMRVMIDCVGILKLRNADIELRNGETDVGRKNTRVRLVFRVHVPQPGGQLVSLQAASHPIECSQRSAQEFPAVERQDLDRCSVLGGQQMVLTGQNFTSDSKVIFSEKTQDGKQIWEVEATVDRDKTQANMLFVEVPPYRSRSISHPAKVNFYVVNGKKKRSQPQHFIFSPMMAIKAEPLDDCHSYIYSDNQCLSGLSMKSLRHHLEHESNLHSLNFGPTVYHRAPVEPRGHASFPDPLDDAPLYYQSVIDNPALYQRYANWATPPHGALMASHPTPAASPCVRAPEGKPGPGPHAGDSVSRYQSYTQTALPLGKSPSRYAPPPSQAKAGGRAEPLDHGGSAYEERAPGRVPVKRENPRYAYLEDVNDIIRRDMKGHNGE
ncbi:nuclear factor of activated T-cells, cytoplasmic 2 [Pungitius pungitius]|uniref:nuclear factor of activated T-cells, cytoplasmic 2 n=1 Tax=Pungitius pungitius TaxID=134920 RepID=UPI002E0DD257